MNNLFLLQFACCIISSMLSLMLAFSRFQMRWPNRRYELSRWLLCFSMATLAGHYILQMTCGYRASNCETGAVVNLFFYTPITFILAYAIYNLVSQRSHCKQFLCIGIISYALIAGIYMAGQLMQSHWWIYAMLGVYMVALVYCVCVNMKAILSHRRLIEEESGVDMLPFDRFAGACFMYMCLSMFMLMSTLLSNTLLLVFGPLMIMSLFVFVVSFIGYGFNIMPADMMLDACSAAVSEAAVVSDSVPSPSAVPCGDGETARPVQPALQLSDERIAAIDEALERWCDEGGFRDSAVNMISLSTKTNIPRVELSMYFERHMNSTFRVWLSNLRFNAAQQMLRENPHYSNDAVSTECGFSSHGHLYKIFKAKTGMTPRQWRESLE